MPRRKKRTTGLKLFDRDGIWYVRGTVGPRHRRQKVYETTGTSDPVRAEQYRVAREGEIWDEVYGGPKAVRTFADAADVHIARPRKRTKRLISSTDLRRVRRLVEHLGAKRLAEIDEPLIRCIADKICKPGSSDSAKLRAVWAPASAIMMDAARLKWCERPTWEKPAPGKERNDWWRPSEAAVLIAHAADHMKPILIFAFGTGARVSEIVNLVWPDVDMMAASAILRDTKNGRSRIVYLSPATVVALANLPHREGHVFRKPGPWRKTAEGTKVQLLGEAYAPRRKSTGGHYKTGWAGACRRAGFGTWETRDRVNSADMMVKARVFVPAKSPHSTRHAWATWFYAATRDPKRLMIEGDWSSMSQVDRYVHAMSQDLVPMIEEVWGVVSPDLFHAVASRAKPVQPPGEIAKIAAGSAS